MRTLRQRCSASRWALWTAVCIVVLQLSTCDAAETWQNYNMNQKPASWWQGLLANFAYPAPATLSQTAGQRRRRDDPSGPITTVPTSCAGPASPDCCPGDMETSYDASLQQARCTIPDCVVVTLGTRGYFNRTTLLCDPVRTCTTSAVITYDPVTNSCIDFTLPPPPPVINLIDTFTPLNTLPNVTSAADCNHGVPNANFTACICDPGWNTPTTNLLESHSLWCSRQEENVSTASDTAGLVELVFVIVAVVIGFVVCCIAGRCIWRRYKAKKQQSAQSAGTRAAAPAAPRPASFSMTQSVPQHYVSARSLQMQQISPTSSEDDSGSGVTPVHEYAMPIRPPAPLPADELVRGSNSGGAAAQQWQPPSNYRSAAAPRPSATTDAQSENRWQPPSHYRSATSASSSNPVRLNNASASASGFRAPGQWVSPYQTSAVTRPATTRRSNDSKTMLALLDDSSSDDDDM
ncbi:hypothetical protein CAOG_001450 [Capsaspora owczarzaki ATCC 30864]|uniref:EGF-like domain-containing protein n=1 Tax=Capsaspora owczarzaki (strain ATCC 30864) TaxID=595528 RepID=A0A0D2WJA1_CAPO3|nr:hypothetical protein CAOG_001450 [Capsaspora owczarzaki ATCC 30864]